MLLQQLLASSRTSCFSGGALHNPLRGFQIDGANGHAAAGHHLGTYLTFDIGSIPEQLFPLNFRGDNDIFSAEIGIVHADRDGTAVMNRWVTADDLLNVVRIDILAANDKQVFLSANNVKLALQIEPKISR